MLCPLCGADVGEKISLCDPCKAKQEAERLAREKEEQDQLAAEEASSKPSGRRRRKKAADALAENETAGEESAESVLAEDFSPAGFWWRAFAVTFDSILLFFLCDTIGKIFNISAGSMVQLVGGGTAAIALSIAAVGASLGLYAGVHLLYYSLFESSSFRATPGKLLFGLQVVDSAGEKASFGIAAVRWIASGFSIATAGIGFLLAAITDQKRALHDMMSGCYVEKDNEVSTTRRLSCAIGTVLLVFFLPTGQLHPGTSEDGPNIKYNSQHFQTSEGGTSNGTEQLGTNDPKIELGQVPDVEPGSPGYILIDKSAVTIRSAVAFRNPIDKLIYVGLYEHALTDEQRKQIRTLGSITALENEQPLAWIKMRFAKDARSCNLATLEQYTLTLQRSGPIFLKDDLPSIEFNRAGSWKQSSEISKFECAFVDNGRFRGLFNDTSLYQFSDGPIRFTWYLELDIPVIAIAEEDAIKIEKAKQKKTRGSADFTFPGTITINGNESQFRSTFGVIYPQYNRVEIGFYVDPLTEADLGLLRESRFLKQIKTKLPSAVLNLKFKKGSKSATLDQLEGYNLYMYRDSLGKLSFPGSEEVLGINREEPIELKRDFSEMSGELGAGKTLSAVIDADHNVSDLRINAEVFLHFKVTPVAAK